MTKSIKISSLVLVAVMLILSVTPTFALGKVEGLDEALEDLEYVFPSEGDGDVQINPLFNIAKNSIEITGTALEIISLGEFRSLSERGIKLRNNTLFIGVDESNPNLVILIKRNDRMPRGYDRFPMKRNPSIVAEDAGEADLRITAVVDLNGWAVMGYRSPSIAGFASSMLDNFVLHIPGIGEFIPALPDEG